METKERMIRLSLNWSFEMDFYANKWTVILYYVVYENSQLQVYISWKLFFSSPMTLFPYLSSMFSVFFSSFSSTYNGRNGSDSLDLNRSNRCVRVHIVNWNRDRNRAKQEANSEFNFRYTSSLYLSSSFFSLYNQLGLCNVHVSAAHRIFYQFNFALSIDFKWKTMRINLQRLLHIDWEKAVQSCKANESDRLHAKTYTLILIAFMITNIVEKEKNQHAMYRFMWEWMRQIRRIRGLFDESKFKSKVKLNVTERITYDAIWSLTTHSNCRAYLLRINFFSRADSFAITLRKDCTELVFKIECIFF